MRIDFKKIEKKWQKKWESKNIFKVKEDKKKKKYYVLEMFPYPSGSGLHMGHAFNYTIGDIYARFMRMKGFNVLYPMGYDSLGLPAENAAIKMGKNPKTYTENSIKNFIKQQKELGLSYDWSRMIKSNDPNYYKWDQWIFLKMLERGIAYRKKSSVNWCSKCNTVLANEQVHDGKCWRHEDTGVEVKQLEQWFLKITNYVEELLEEIDNLDWPERVKIMQKNWIGKSHGTEIYFEVDRKKWSIFTTRPDTIFGVTFMVVSAQHSRLMELVTQEKKKDVEKFINKLKSTSGKELDKLDKEGVFTGSYATNPINGEKVPVWAGNFVVADYGSGMVMAVPAHDQRDFEFSEKYSIPKKVVIEPVDFEIYEREGELPRAYLREGTLTNSEKFDGMENKKAKEEITKYLQNKKLGRKVIQYKLRDWLISRQRYWGAPIPIVYCGRCGIIPINEKELPVILPEKVKFGKGNPLETNKKFLEINCPKCGGKARRETDTMDTFANSSWYFLRYCDPKNNKKIFDEKKVDYWAPVDTYIGGAEHACMHLIYFRFYTKFLRDLGLLNFGEPVKKLFNQGMLHGEDGYVMSKSRGNVVLPSEVSKKYGIDTARLFLMSIASPDKDLEWNEKGIEGSSRFINKIFKYFSEIQIGKIDSRLESKLNLVIKNVSNYIREFKYNLAVIEIRELFDYLPQKISKKVLEDSLKLLHPFCPHVSEELWEKLGNKNFLSLEKWPKLDEKKINEKFEKQDKAIDKLITDINNIFNLVEGKEKVFVYVIPNEKEIYDFELIKSKSKRDIKIFSVSDKDKYDPSGISKKTKPGRPAIYLE